MNTLCLLSFFVSLCSTLKIDFPTIEVPQYSSSIKSVFEPNTTQSEVFVNLWDIVAKQKGVKINHNEGNTTNLIYFRVGTIFNLIVLCRSNNSVSAKGYSVFEGYQ